MTCIDNNEIVRPQQSFIQAGWAKLTSILADIRTQHAELRQQKLNRQAFLNLVGKEDWVYDDLGLSAADVEWAARLPLDRNAAQELEKRRCDGLKISR